MARGKKDAVAAQPGGRLDKSLLCSVLLVLVAVPLTFSTTVHRIYALPRFVVLLVGSALSLVLLAMACTRRLGYLKPVTHGLRSRHSTLVLLFFGMLAVSTAFGVAPVASVFGSFENQMGLITRLCYLILFAGVIVSVGDSKERLDVVLWAMSLTGLVTAAYATAQFFGQDPFVPASLYTFDSASGPVVRVGGTLGHSNYLGNFLLYTTPVSAALAFSTAGQARRIALATTVVSVAAIAFSGTRGAWLGFAAGAVTFAAIESRGNLRSLLPGNRRRMLLAGAAALAIIGISLWLMASAGASQSVLIRARSFVSDRFTGSGRTLLWRDSLKMAPDFAIVGCGPEGFRKAFLSYKSKQLAQLAPQINNESSHNSYLDAAISSGLGGAALYAAMIGSAFSLLLRARSRGAGRDVKLATSGIVSALAAVAVHNFFIFDQIPTGLYFFTALGLAQAASNVAGAREGGETIKPSPAPSLPPVLSWAAVGVAGTVAIAAVWFGLVLLRADLEIKRALGAASTVTLSKVIEHGSRAAETPDPTGAYHFMFARAITLCLDTAGRENRLDERARTTAIDIATREAGRALPHTLTPDSNNLLIGYLSYLGGDVRRQRFYATEALKWDPYYPNSHWLLAEAFLAEGNGDRAASEAEQALEISPSTPGARSVLRRAREEDQGGSVQGMIEASRVLVGQGRVNKAERILLRALNRAEGRCTACHRELALLYEKNDFTDKAIVEWEAFARDAPDAAGAAEAAARIENLRHRRAQSQ